MDILLINCTLPSEDELVVVLDDEGFELAGLNVLQLVSRQTIAASTGK
jgi:hypothetical protein